ncbi:MAG: nucleotidyltransferase domain-containing protein [Thioalkalivibrio sp.]|nr:nucleotidyltransferase domain-containing protein [Thioalkalivibrio sp.]
MPLFYGRDMANRLAIDPDTIARVCARHHIRKLSLFGSVLAGTDRLDSDVDLLVEFAPGEKPGLLGLAAIEAELSALLDGRRVDLRTPEDLSLHFRGHVLSIAEVQHER